MHYTRGTREVLKDTLDKIIAALQNYLLLKEHIQLRKNIFYDLTFD